MLEWTRIGLDDFTVLVNTTQILATEASGVAWLLRGCRSGLVVRDRQIFFYNTICVSASSICFVRSGLLFVVGWDLHCTMHCAGATPIQVGTSLHATPSLLRICGLYEGYELLWECDELQSCRTRHVPLHSIARLGCPVLHSERSITGRRPRCPRRRSFRENRCRWDR